MKEILLGIAERLMRCPAAPYHESLVAREVFLICAEYGLAAESDPFGNILIRGKGAPSQRPLVLAAHMDHPGFTIQKKISPSRYAAEFLGGVGDSYFRHGTKLRLMPGRVPAALGKRLTATKRLFEIETLEPVAIESGKPEFAVWDLTEFELRNEMICGRACDDLIGVAVILAVLVELRRTRANVIGAISRAEEVGFHGALALAQSKRFPKNGLIISLETSREMAPVRQGDGVIIRVGDKTSIFDSTSTRFLIELAGDLAKINGDFIFQRALMSGGTCEATAYQEYGYRCAAVCVALGKYHNCAPNDRIAEETVSLADSIRMAELLTRAGAEIRNFEKIAKRLTSRLDKYRREAVAKLKRRRVLLDGH
jgi:putative aminopeptidase FrvX